MEYYLVKCFYVSSNAHICNSSQKWKLVHKSLYDTLTAIHLGKDPYFHHKVTSVECIPTCYGNTLTCMLKCKWDRELETCQCFSSVIPCLVFFFYSPVIV
jgi:hypothetical protein